MNIYMYIYIYLYIYINVCVCVYEFTNLLCRFSKFNLNNETFNKSFKNGQQELFDIFLNNYSSLEYPLH